MSDFSPAYHLDPFTDIVEVHWGGGTKLDFVYDRYQVAGKKRTRTQVVDHPEYRTSATGLDLRRPLVGGEYHPDVNNARPTKLIDDALHEFSYLGGTIVVEADYYDTRLIFPVAYADIYEDPVFKEPWDDVAVFLSSEKRDLGGSGARDQRFALEQTLEAVRWSGVGDDAPISTEDFDFWELDTQVSYNGPFIASTEGTPGAIPWFNAQTGVTEWYHGDPAGDLYIFRRVVHYLYGQGPTVLYRIQYNTDGTPISTPYDLDTRYLGPIPPPETGFTPSTTFVEGVDPYYTVESRPAISAFDWTDPDHNFVPNVYRGITPPFDPINSLSAPPGISAPYGRVRMACTATNGKLVMSVNGSDPETKVIEPASFTMPRTPPVIAINKKRFRAAEGYAVVMQGYFVMRCIWLFRKPKADAVLKKMSVVRPLIPGTSGNWLNGGLGI